MSRMVLVVALLIALITLAAPSAQTPPDIEPVNAHWVQFFNSGDFVGIGSLIHRTGNRIAARLTYGEWQSGNSGDVERIGGSSQRSRRKNRQP